MARNRCRSSLLGKRYPHRSVGFSLPYRLARFELLEPRRVLSGLTLNVPDQVTVLAGAPLHIALDGEGGVEDLSYTAAVEAGAPLTAEIPEGNRSMRISVSYAEGETGEMVFELFEDLVPRVTDRIIDLAQQGFYDELTFHRIIKDFMIQGGDPLGDGTGGSGVDFDDQFHVDLQHTSSGILSMAKTIDDTNDSQFFITSEPTRWLDFNHSIFGFLTEGDDVREAIEDVPTDASDKPTSDVVMTSVDVFTDNENAVLRLSATQQIAGPIDVVVTVTDEDGNEVSKTVEVTVVEDTTDGNPFLDDIPEIRTTSGTSANFQLTAIDAEGDEAVFFDEETLDYYKTQYDELAEPHDFYVPVWAHADLDYTVDFETGEVVVTPTNGLSGVHSITVATASDISAVDYQVVPILIDPAAPTAIELLAGTDTGTSSNDGVTGLNNSADADALRFRVYGVVDGAEVTLFAGDDLIGQAVVPTGSAGEVIVITDGTTTLGDGIHSITAVQTLRDQEVNPGKLDYYTVDLASDPSAPLEIIVDTASPVFSSTPVTEAYEGEPYEHNVETNEESGGGMRYALDTSPAGMSIHPDTGKITWTPSETQGGGQFSVVIAAQDQAGNEVLRSFAVTVEERWEVPDITPIETQTVFPGESLTVSVEAHDPDVPSSPLNYHLGPDVPDGMTIDHTGLLTWDVPDDQPAGIYTATVEVSKLVDAGPMLPAYYVFSSETTLTVVVNNPGVIYSAFAADDAMRGRITASGVLAPAHVDLSFVSVPDGGVASPAAGAVDLLSADLRGLSALGGGDLGIQIGADTGVGRGLPGEQVEANLLEGLDRREEIREETGESGDQADKNDKQSEAANQLDSDQQAVHDAALELLMESVELAMRFLAA